MESELKTDPGDIVDLADFNFGEDLMKSPFVFENGYFTRIVCGTGRETIKVSGSYVNVHVRDKGVVWLDVEDHGCVNLFVKDEGRVKLDVSGICSVKLSAKNHGFVDMIVGDNGSVHVTAEDSSTINYSLSEHGHVDPVCLDSAHVNCCGTSTHLQSILKRKTTRYLRLESAAHKIMGKPIRPIDQNTVVNDPEKLLHDSLQLYRLVKEFSGDYLAIYGIHHPYKDMLYSILRGLEEIRDAVWETQ